MLLGTWAQEKAERAAREGWENGHSPSLPIWRHALGSRGFRPELDPKIIHPIFRTLPSRLSDSRTAWMDEAASWVVLPSTDSSGQPLAFCERCQQPGKGWRPFQMSWNGFEAIFQEIDQARASRPEGGSPGKKGSLRHWDPREIRY